MHLLHLFLDRQDGSVWGVEQLMPATGYVTSIKNLVIEFLISSNMGHPLVSFCIHPDFSLTPAALANPKLIQRHHIRHIPLQAYRCGKTAGRNFTYAPLSAEEPVPSTSKPRHGGNEPR